MPKLILHIGYPKTGTTSIQQFLTNNCDVLRGRGILYPHSGRRGGAHYSLTESLDLARRRKETGAPHDIMAAVRQETKVAGSHTVILSSEQFVLAEDLDELETLFAPFEVYVIVYLRRHDKALESSYGQAVKTVETPRWSDIESFIARKLHGYRPSYDYLAVLNDWSATFGKDRMIVRPFERGQNMPDLYHDFLAGLGIAWFDELTIPEEDSNVSLSPKMVAAIDAVQRSSVAKEVKERMVRAMTKVDAELAAKRTTSHLPSRLSPAFRMDLVSRYEDAYREIATTYLGRPDGVLFAEPPPSATEAWQPPGEISAVDAVDLLLQAIAFRRSKRREEPG